MSSFTVIQEQRQYTTYILTDCENSSHIEVVPERGGIVTQWQVGEYQIFYLDGERFRDPNLTVRGGIPILFPICGNLPDDHYRYGDQVYQLKQHGFARNLPWQVVEQFTENDAAITLTLKSSPETKAAYPFDFQLFFTYRLRGTTLWIEQKYVNLSSEVMPFSAGFHPYFFCPDKEKLQFEIPAAHYFDTRTKEVATFGQKFDFTLNEIDWAFLSLSASQASVVDPVRALKLTLDYPPLFNTLVFWTLQGKEFYCLEPWTAPRNALNTGESLISLEPGQSLQTVVRLHIDRL